MISVELGARSLALREDALPKLSVVFEEVLDLVIAEGAGGGRTRSNTSACRSFIPVPSFLVSLADVITCWSSASLIRTLLGPTRDAL